MEKSTFSLTQLYKDKAMVELARKTDQKTLAAWAIDCAERVLPYFEEKYGRANIDLLRQRLLYRA